MAVYFIKAEARSEKSEDVFDTGCIVSGMNAFDAWRNFFDRDEIKNLPDGFKFVVQKFEKVE